MPSREYFFDEEHEEVRKASRTLLTNIAVLLGADVNTAQQNMAEVFNLDAQLANVRKQIDLISFLKNYSQYYSKNHS